MKVDSKVETRGVSETSPSGDGGTTLRVVLVTGLSGAGRTSCLKVLEDLGYEAVDNLPLPLVERLLDPRPQRPIAIGLDFRTRGFDSEALIGELERLRARPDLDATILFLDCDSEVLARRFTETRRRHPLALDRPVGDGIDRERQLMGPVREQADDIIDTTALSAADLRRELRNRLALERRQSVVLTVLSFSYRHGLPREADLVFDVRFLENPHYDPLLRPLDGRDPRVGARVSSDDDFKPFLDNLTRLLAPLLPRYYSEGKSYLTVAIGCTGGRHRSVFVAEELARWLGEQGHQVSVHHRDMERSPS
ncbi:MAG: RNase adapter RapZ [Alphaproteobacteria bacterium]|nr:RNase adapter RapZ [Alphaproteobacteria bacterium]